MPLWLYTAGKKFSTTDTKIPFPNILLSLTLLIVPCVVGILIRKYKSKAADALMKYLRPVAIIAIVSLIATGLYVNSFVFILMIRRGLGLVLPCVAIPWTGFIVGLAVALLLQQTWPHAKTIAIETGIQNMNIALVLLRYSLPSPHSELSTVPALIAGLSATLPLFVCMALHKMAVCIQHAWHHKSLDLPTEDHVNPTYVHDEETVSKQPVNDSKSPNDSIEPSYKLEAVAKEHLAADESNDIQKEQNSSKEESVEL